MDLIRAVETTNRLRECRDTMTRLFGERWPAKSAEWQQAIRAVMWVDGVSAAQAVLTLTKPITNDWSHDPAPAVLLLAALCDLLEEKHASQENPPPG